VEEIEDVPKKDMPRNKPRCRKPSVMPNSENELQISARTLEKLLAKNEITISEKKNENSDRQYNIPPKCRWFLPNCTASQTRRSSPL
jgi:hypothetical protein